MKLEILVINIDASTSLVAIDGIQQSIEFLPGPNPAAAIRKAVYQQLGESDWLGFRRALIAAPEYPLAVSLALTNPALGVADGKMGQAIDACLNQGAEPEEVAAFQSALALYLSQLPDDADGQAIATRIQALCADHQIPTN